MVERVAFLFPLACYWINSLLVDFSQHDLERLAAMQSQQKAIAAKFRITLKAIPNSPMPHYLVDVRFVLATECLLRYAKALACLCKGPGY
jgi:hypothetical protein